MKIKKTLISILTGFCISLMIASLFTACNENSTTNNSTENKKTDNAVKTGAKAPETKKK